MPDRPAHRMPRLWGVVAAGGALGALGRAGLATAWHHTWWATFVINVIGAFVLGSLLEHLTRTGERRTLRLLLGTGFCGAFTTYSTFAHDTTASTLNHGLMIGAGEVLAGLAAAAAGAWASTMLSPTTPENSPDGGTR